jgi:hypothetical protein
MPPTLEEDEEDYPGEDTIVVKGEYHWSHPSSPESMSSEIEPLVANLLGQINTPQNVHSQELESPEPREQEEPTTDTIHELRRARRSSHPNPKSRPKPNIPTMEEKLMLMPEKRPLPVCKVSAHLSSSTSSFMSFRRLLMRHMSFGILFSILDREVADS